LVKAFARALVYGNIWIGFAAASLGLAMTNVISGGLIFDPLFFLLCGRTWMTYTAMRLRSVIQKEISPEGVLLNWVRHHRKLNVLFCALGAGMTFWAVLRLNTLSWIMLAVSAIISLAYVMPVFSVEGVRKEMRELSTIKTGLVALVWAITTVGISWSLFGSGDFPWLLILAVFLLIQGLTVPFDIRDLYFDKQMGLETIANSKGVLFAKAISLILLILSILCFVFYLYAVSNAGLLLFLGTWLAVAIALVFATNENRPEWWYTFLLDGTIIIFSWGLILCLNQ
jgi:4-hydroxybenzoate polyprenyltransferase